MRSITMNIQGYLDFMDMKPGHIVYVEGESMIESALSFVETMIYIDSFDIEVSWP